VTAKPCTHGGHNHTILLATQKTWGRTWSSYCMMVASCEHRGTGVVPLSRTCKPERKRARARIDHMEFSYEDMIKIIMYSYIYIALHIRRCYTLIWKDIFEIMNSQIV